MVINSVGLCIRIYPIWLPCADRKCPDPPDTRQTGPVREEMVSRLAYADASTVFRTVRDRFSVCENLYLDIKLGSC